MKLPPSLKLRLIVWIWKLTPNCAEMSRLASLSLDQKPSLGLRWKMRLHHVICVWCRRYGEQLRFLRRAVRQHPDRFADAAPRGLSPESRERLKRVLRDGMK